MALKEVLSKRRTIEFDMNGKHITMTLKRFEGKVRKKDPVTFKSLGWGMSGYTCVKCDLFPNADWRPYVDFGEKTTDCSLDGWEMKEPEWETVDSLAMSMLFEYKGWTADEKYEPVEKILKKIKG